MTEVVRRIEHHEAKEQSHPQETDEVLGSIIGMESNTVTGTSNSFRVVGSILMESDLMHAYQSQQEKGQQVV
jgi:hypothetical protein